MLYHIVIVIIFAALAYAVIVLFRKVAVVQKRRKELQLKESEFMNILVSETNRKPGDLFGMHDFIDDYTVGNDGYKANSTDSELGIEKIRNLMVTEINKMSEGEIRQFYKAFQEKRYDKTRRHDRKDFYMIVDYSVDDQYYRDFIQDISESGVFIKTSQTFSENQNLHMTFMSPDYQKPFKIRGQIVRIGKDGVGVKFKIDSQVQVAALKNFVSRIQKDTIES